MAVDDGGDLGQEATAVGGRHGGPRSVERRACRGHGAVDVGGAAAGQPGPHPTRTWLVGVEGGAVTGERRMPKMPDVPTVKEAAKLDYTTDIWIFVLGPKGIPESVLTALNKEFITALDDKSVRERLTGFGLEVTEGRDNTAAHLKKHIDDFAMTYGKLIAEQGIKAE